MGWARFKKKDMPGGLWIKCPACGEVIFKKDLDANQKVCPKCDHHNTLIGMERVKTMLDEGSAVELVPDMVSVDRLNFTDKTSYAEKLKKTMAKTSRKEAIWIGTGKICGRDVIFGTLDFSFLGGSMGVVVGEKITVAVEHATEHKLPLVLVAASGGARMHEGALSLMQMAKSCTALGRMDDVGGLYVSVLANPTTGGVTASWATQADVVLAEPGALIGFAGPRVIKTTLRQDLPEGFQRSEFLISKGQVDAIIHRDKLRGTIWEIMEYCAPMGNGVRKKRPDVKAEGLVDKTSEEEAKEAKGKKKADKSKTKEDSKAPKAKTNNRKGREKSDRAKAKAKKAKLKEEGASM